MIRNGTLCGMSLCLVVSIARSRELADVELPRAPNGVADKAKWPGSRMVVNVTRKGEVFVDRTDVAFGQQYVLANWKLVPGLTKVDAKALAAHLNQGRRFHNEIRQAAPPEWPQMPHVVLRLDRNAPWGLVEPIFPLLEKETLVDLRIGVELGKKIGVLPTALLARVPPKAEALKITIAKKGLHPDALAKPIAAFVARHNDKRRVAVISAHQETRVASVITALDALAKAGITEIRFVASAKKG